MNYFMCPQEQCTNKHAKIQPKNMYGYFCIISTRFGFINFYTEKYCKNGNMVKLSRYICSHGF
jgi:hypothetical protein